MELRDYVRIFRRRWKSIAALVLLGLLLGLAFTLASPEVFAAQSKVYVKLSDVTPSTAYNANQYVLGQMPSYAQLDGSPQVLDPVIAELHLTQSAQQLASQVVISNPASTVYLDIDVQAGSLHEAKRIADATGAQLADVIENLQESATSDRVVLARSQSATGSPSAVSPKLSLDLALGLVLGLILGLISAILRNRLDTSISSAEDLRLLTGVAPLACVRTGPDVEGGDEQLSAEQLSAYRALRTDLALASGGHLPPSVVVFGSGCDDGRDVALNLARVAARSGIKTCLVEADLRRPRLAATLSTHELTGLTAVLEGRADLADAVTAWPLDPADAPAVVVAGVAADDPADLLDSPAMARTHRMLAATFDLVLYIGPPAEDGSDSVILARDSAAAVLVVRAGASERTGFSTSAEALAAVGATVAGAVLVAAPGGRPARRLARKRAAAAGDPVPLSAAPLTPVPLIEPTVPFAPGRAGGFVAPDADPHDQAHRRRNGAEPAFGPTGVLPPRARSSRGRRTPSGGALAGIAPAEPAAEVASRPGLVIASGSSRPRR